VPPVSLLDHLFKFGFVKTCEFLFAFNDDRTLEQVRILQHQSDGFIFGRRLLLHVLFSIERRARVQERLDRIIADDLAQLLLRERMFSVLALFKINLFYLQETSCFSTAGSGGLVNKFEFVSHHTPFKST